MLPLLKMASKHEGVHIQIKFAVSSMTKSNFTSDYSSFYHGGGSRDILLLYSDRTSNNIHHYFFNSQ